MTADLSVPAPQPNPSAEDGWVRFYFDDADPVAECACGWHTHGDSASDAFGAWWKHRREHDDAADERRSVVPSARVDLDLDAIEAAFAHVESTGGARPYGSLSECESCAIAIKAGLALVAEVRRLRETVEALAQSTSDLGRDLLIEGERADAARAEAERLRENAITGNEVYRKLIDALGFAWNAPDDEHESAWVDSEDLERQATALRAEAARVREALQAIRSPEAIERAAEALYEEGRPDTYTGEEWDWPNIDHAYDWDGDHDERGNPEGQSPEWLRDRYRAEARAALDAALDGETNG